MVGSRPRKISMVSSRMQGARCFVEGAIIETTAGSWVDIEKLSRRAQVCGPENQSIVYVNSVEPIPFGPHELIEISAGGPRLVTTSTHRYEIRRGSCSVAAPAKSLRVGYAVACAMNSGEK